MFFFISTTSLIHRDIVERNAHLSRTFVSLCVCVCDKMREPKRTDSIYAYDWLFLDEIIIGGKCQHAPMPQL